MSYIGQTLPSNSFEGYTTDTFAGDGSATTFTMSKAPFNESAVIVVINNVIQKPTTNFTVSGTTLTIVGTAVASGDVIYATHTGGAIPINTASALDLNGASDQLILDADGDSTISADTDDQIDFKAGGTDVMSMTATGLTINDGTTITTADNTDTLTLVSTDTDASLGPHLVLHRNAGNGADNDFCGEISFPGNDDAGNAFDIARFTSQIIDASNGSEDGKFYFNLTVQGSEQEIFNANAFGGGGAEFVVNDGSNDINFRVESDNDTNVFRVDAGTDCVIVGGTSRTSDAIFNVQSSANAKTIEVDNTNASFAQDMLRFDTTRSNHSAFNFLRMMSGNSSDSEFIMTGEGNMYADGTFNANGADYAEFFETEDGNSIDVGKTVVLDGNKVRASTSSDDAATVIGVVRPKVDGINSMIVGNTAWNSWTNRYLHDDYGRFIMEDYTVTEWETSVSTDGVKNTLSYDTDKIPSDVTVPSDAVVKTQQRRKANPDYDKSKEYKPRAERDEWVIIGMLGQIQITKGQKTGTNWIKMRDISDTVEEWLVR
jgi:hypothetical protein